MAFKKLDFSLFRKSDYQEIYINLLGQLDRVRLTICLTSGSTGPIDFGLDYLVGQNF